MRLFVTPGNVSEPRPCCNEGREALEKPENWEFATDCIEGFANEGNGARPAKDWANGIACWLSTGLGDSSSGLPSRGLAGADFAALLATALAAAFKLPPECELARLAFSLRFLFLASSF